jgi:glycosyltransferase involved in cell wall biosynthesis
LEAQVRREGVKDAVFFHGTIPYDGFSDAVGDAFVFIGHGTSLAEAAACGVPSLVGIDSQTAPDTYGFIHETTGAELGSHLPGLPEHPIREKLSWLASLSSSEYRAVEQATRARAEDFAISRLMPRFVDILRSTSAFSLATSSADLVLDRLDRRLAAALSKCGVPTAIGDRHLREVSVDG